MLTIRLDVYHYAAGIDRAEGDRIIKAIAAHLNAEGAAIMADLTQITAAVAAEGDAVQSAITLLNGLKAQLDAAGTDPAALADLSAKLGAQTDALAAAVVANTPAAAPQA